MTRFILRLWPEDLASRAAGLSMIANFVLMIVKLAVGVITNSVAVLSDGLDSAQDMVAAGIAFLSVRIGRRPADPDHPFGHGRAETIAAAIQALMIAGGATYIVYSAIRRLIDPPDSIGTDLGLITMAVAAVVNLVISRYSSYVARVTRSPAIASDARHLMTNVVQALAILAGLALVAITGEVVFDGILALALGFYLYWIAGGILWTSASDVLDISLDDEEIAKLETIIEGESTLIAGYHHLRTRRSGQVRHIDFHLLLPSEMSVEESHAITSRIEERIQSEWPDSEVVIHVEPDGESYAGPLIDRDLNSNSANEDEGRDRP